MAGRELISADLARRCDAERFSFTTTEELEDLTAVLGQPRATEALRLAMDLRRPGYNLFAAGSQGSGRHAMVRMFLTEQAATEAAAGDLCYVHSFADPQAPMALRLPPGRGRALAADMEDLVEELGQALPAAFESDQYRLRRQALDEELSAHQEEIFGQLRERARARGLEVMRAPAGLMFVPRREGEVLSPEEFAKLSDEERERLSADVEALQKESQELLRQVPKFEKELRERIRELNRQVTSQAVGHLIEPLRHKHEDMPQVAAYLDAVRDDVVQNHGLLFATEGAAPQDGAGPGRRPAPEGDGVPLMRRYRVNVLVDHGGADTAPVVYEDNPTFPALLGRIEHRAEMGALLTDYSLIKAGALHRANGGYLILDAHKVVTQPYAWEGLKRSLRSREIRIESLGQVSGMASTSSLEPQPVPLDLKVVLVGEHRLYYALRSMDPDFEDLFKVAADFDDQMPRDPESETAFAGLIATLARRHDLLPFERMGVARMVDYGARATGDQERLTTRVRDLTEVMTEAHHRAAEAQRDAVSAADVEAHHRAAEAQRDAVSAADVQGAIEAREYRTGRIRERLQEQILRGTILVDTEGTEVGQINGLAVLQVGGAAFGRPSRITARIRMGEGKVVDIEREVELSGPTHSKGVLILSSFLAGRYALDQPLSLSASLVFEQSYGGVDGDSASSAELYALLSAIAEVPIHQRYAVTGSVNQLGQVQAIGGVNEKVEGFFDICRARGLTGDQGVLIPAANVKHLMLRDDVVAAVEAGRFHVFAVETIDEGIAWLTGMPAGEPGDDGSYSAATVNGRVQRRLQDLADKREALGEAMRRRTDAEGPS